MCDKNFNRDFNPEEIEIRQIQWREAIALRHAVLWPNKEPGFCHVEGDEGAWHFGAFLVGKLIAVASVYPDEQSARLRKFAISPEYQGKGIGTKMLNHILAELRAESVTQFWCDARQSAVGFYERFGLRSFGERFYKGEVPYFKMSIQLK